MPLKPQNIIQAADADLKRSRRNSERAERKEGNYEQYAFHRKHVRRADNAHDLIRLALMDPAAVEKTVKANTLLIYGDARLLVEAIRITPG